MGVQKEVCVYAEFRQTHLTDFATPFVVFCQVLHPKLASIKLKGLVCLDYQVLVMVRGKKLLLM